MINELITLDGNILLFIQEYLRNSIFTPIFKIITSLGDAGVIWIIITFALVINKKTRRVGYICILSLLGTLIINNIILKNVVARVRPFNAVPGLAALIAEPVDFSFPSGHTAVSFSAAVVIYRNCPKKYGVPAIVLACLIAISRLYLGVHYPSDVLAGIISGVSIAYFSQYVMNLISKYYNLSNKVK